MWMKIFYEIEKKMLRRYSHETSEQSQVFVIGLPRSGTTLFYQLLLNYFNWSYFTTWTHSCFRFPVTAYKIQHLIFPKPKYFEYKSDYGKMQDPSYLAKPWRPVEGNRIWQRWFPGEQTHCYRGSLSSAVREEMLSTITAFTAISGHPFLSKTPRNSVRLLTLSEVFPKALFVVVKRDSLYVAQSLYTTRLRRRSGKKHRHNGWWGTKPNEFVYLKHLDPLRQSIGQTIALDRELSAQLAICKNSYIEIKYGDFCENPRMVLDLIQETCLKNDIRIQRIRDVEPAPFKSEDKRKVSEKEFNTMKGLLNQDGFW